METKRPKVGLGVIIIKEEQVLLGKRKNFHGNGTWSFPGGHLEYFETLKDCALRETKEETGLKIELIDENPVAITNDLFSKEKEHYITLFVKAKYIDGEPKVMEQDKCEEWYWFEWNKFPKELFLPIKNLLKQNYNPFKE